MLHRILLVLLLSATAALAAATAPQTPALVPTLPPPEVEAASYAVLDFETGAILAGRDPDVPREPASVTKVLTAWVVFEAFTSGEVKPTDTALVSQKAYRMGGSRMFIEIGSRVPVQELVKGMLAVSGNDAAVALAEHLSGSEEAFAERMNRAAAELGMTHTHFTNASGVSDPAHVTSARDLVILGRAIIQRHPDLYPLFSQHVYTWNNISQPNRNALLREAGGFDGLKTGFTVPAGYCILASALRNQRRVVVAVLGAPTPRKRTDAARALLEWGQERWKVVDLIPAGVGLGRSVVEEGEVPEVEVGVVEALRGVVPVTGEVALELKRTPLTAPVPAGAPAGEVVAIWEGKELGRRPLTALTKVDEKDLWDRAVEVLFGPAPAPSLEP